jgi:MoxR-like ATPase
MDNGAEKPSGEDLAAVEELAAARKKILGEIEKRVVGQREVVDHLLI